MRIRFKFREKTGVGSLAHNIRTPNFRWSAHPRQREKLWYRKKNRENIIGNGKKGEKKVAAVKKALIKSTTFAIKGEVGQRPSAKSSKGFLLRNIRRTFRTISRAPTAREPRHGPLGGWPPLSTPPMATPPPKYSDRAAKG